MTILHYSAGRDPAVLPVTILHYSVGRDPAVLPVTILHYSAGRDPAVLPVTIHYSAGRDQPTHLCPCGCCPHHYRDTNTLPLGSVAFNTSWTLQVKTGWPLERMDFKYQWITTAEDRMAFGEDGLQIPVDHYSSRQDGLWRGWTSNTSGSLQQQTGWPLERMDFKYQWITTAADRMAFGEDGLQIPVDHYSSRQDGYTTIQVLTLCLWGLGFRYITLCLWELWPSNT